MRIGAVYQPNEAAHYRAVDPLEAMARRGHEVVWPPDGEGKADLQRLMRCDIVHVYRRFDKDTQRAIKQLVSAGTPITYDNDDDYTAVPKESPRYKTTGGLVGQRIFNETVKLARMARAFTTTTEPLAEKYRRLGVERVEVIGNQVAAGIDRPRNRHDGIVIGWIAGMEHLADVARIDIAGALRRVMEKHAEVRVECVGVNLGLPERYTHHGIVPFKELGQLIGGFDIGIAPLADIPCNRARSDIKVKEYAASGVPWLASPIGPYEGLGEDQGGRLVGDDGWFDALDLLLSRRRERRRLARKARAWARSQTIDAAADRWEHLFAELVRSEDGDEARRRLAG